MNRKIIIKKIVVSVLLYTIIVKTCSIGFAASLDESTALDSDSNTIEEITENKNFFEENESINKEVVSDTVDNIENVEGENGEIIEEQDASEKEDLEKEEDRTAFADKINNIDVKLFDTTMKELSELNMDQVEQVKSLWSENIFNELRAEEVPFAYVNGTDLSEQSGLIVLLANMDMGMKYINDHYDGNGEYLCELNDAYEKIYINLAEMACYTQNSEDYISSLQDVLSYGIENIYDINWSEQEKEDNPRLIYWIYKYFDNQCNIDAQNFFESFCNVENED